MRVPTGIAPSTQHEQTTYTTSLGLYHFLLSFSQDLTHKPVGTTTAFGASIPGLELGLLGDDGQLFDSSIHSRVRVG